MSRKYREMYNFELIHEFKKLQTKEDSGCYCAPIELWDELIYRAATNNKPVYKKPNIIIECIKDNYLLIAMLTLVIIMYILGYLSALNNCGCNI